MQSVAEPEQHSLPEAVNSAKGKMVSALQFYVFVFAVRPEKPGEFLTDSQMSFLWRVEHGRIKNMLMDLILASIKAIDVEERTAAIRKELAQKGIMMKSNGPQHCSILGRFGVLPYSRLSLVSANPDSAKRLLELKQIKGVCPLDHLIGIDRLPFKMTFALMCEYAREAVCARSFQDAAEKIAGRYDLHPSSTQIKAVAMYVGGLVLEKDLALAKEAKEKAEKSADESACRRRENDILYLIIEESRMLLREKNKVSGWAECKYALAFHSINVQERTDDHGKKHFFADESEVIACIGSAEEFKCSLLALARRNQCDLCSKIVVISDGSEWICDLVKELWPEAVQILDLDRAKKSTGKFAGYLRKGRQGDAFAGELCKLLEGGKIGELLEKTKPCSQQSFPENISDFYTFVSKHKDLMHYDEYRKAGYILESGSLEDGNIRWMQERIIQPGMRWSTDVAQRLMALQAKVVSRRWHEVEDLVLKKINSSDAVSFDYDY